MSFQVACWLTGQISEEHQNRLQSYSKNIDLADDRFEAIKDIVMGSGTLRLKAAALKPIKMTRQQYPSAGDYMRQFMTATNTAIGLRCDIGAYVTALLFINELKDDLPNWSYNRQEQLTDDTSKFDWNGFRELYDSAIATYEAAHMEISAAAHHAPRSNNNNNNSHSQPSPQPHNPVNDPAHHGRKLQDGPAAGCKHDDWRDSILAGPQQTVDGRCTYCGIRGHGVKKCWYLMPYLRREDWKPYTKV
jgi:hypothetical protein